MAQVKYLGDGAVQNTTGGTGTGNGGWDLPAQGTCPAGAANGYTGIDTRPECVALRLVAASSAACTAYLPASSTSWTTSGVCNDLVNTTQATCEAQPDRLWNPGTSTCAIVMMDDDRNNLVCAQHGGTWVTAGTCIGVWVMPARTAYTPNLLTSNGAGDQCLRCHNNQTQYNGPRVRDTEDTLYMGHKNMGRKVAVGTPWGGPPFKCSLPAYTNENACEAAGGTWNPEIYPADDSGNPINWTTGQITVGGTPRDLKWIYGDWLAALPRAIYAAPAASSQVCTDPRGTSANCVSTYGGTMVNNTGVTYSCGRCHMTGWSSDAAVNTTKEPEASFAGITWPRTANANFGQVNLSGGVSGDANKYSSWDVWGISCTRCHNSVVDTNLAACTGLTQATCTTLGGSWTSSTSTCSGITLAQCTGNGGTVANNVAPTGMSSHHNNLTVPDISSGTCSDARFTAEAQCTAAGGSWLTACSVNPTAAVCTMAANTSAKCAAVSGTWVAAPGWCSNAFYTTQATCTANAFTWQDGWCTTADTQATCTGGTGDGAKTWRLNGTQASCMVAGATWSFTKCSVEGVCNKGAAYTTPAACAAAGGYWAYATDIIRCLDAGGHWTGNNTNRGQIITRVCMDCHRQETGGLPYGATTDAALTTSGQAACIAAGKAWVNAVCVDYSLTDPAGQLKVGPAHGTVAFVSHPAGNMLLNSPHGKFSGRFDQIATGKFKYDMTGEFKSFFMTEGEAANTGNGCTGCHEVHTSVVAGERPFREECTACHSKNLNLINHPKGTGTPLPLEILGTPEEFEACVSCHMPEGQHLFRINVNESYSTFPMPAALSGTVNANTAADGTYTNAVWSDLDHACGKCHGGGTAQAFTKGTTTSGSANVTVLSTTGFVAGQKVRIKGAGALYYDDIGVGRREDLDSYIKTVTPPTTLVLVGNVSVAVTNQDVTQNATTNGGSWFPKSLLATYAAGIHNDKPTALFNVTYADGNPSMIAVDASQSKCSGSNANCNVYDWDWGDGTVPHGSGVMATHTYATPGTYTITLTVTQYGFQPGVATRLVTAYAYDAPPVASGSCAIDYTTWTATCSNTSTDDNGFQLASINWGDGSVVTNVTSAPFGGPFTHTFVATGNWSIKLTVVDTAGQANLATIGSTVAASFNYYSITGKVFKKDGTTGLGAAQVQVKKGGTLMRSLMTAANGSYSAQNLKPGTYTLTVTKAGYTFAPAPQLTVTVGPNATNQNVTATGP